MTKKQVILGAQFPGVNNFTVWSDPAAGSQIAFSSFRHFAETVERGKFDFIFLAEGLRVREQGGRFHELDVAGRPNTLAILTALASITDHVGLIGTLTTTFNEPYPLARQLATLDILSGGRAGWNVVTSPGAFTGANFRRGDHLPHRERYERAREFLETARKLWTEGGFAAGSRHFDIAGQSALSPLPQGAPVIAQAGDSDEGRELAASHADLIYSRHGSLEAGQAFYADVKRRLTKYGRSPNALKILPGANFVIGDTQADAQEKLRAIRLQQVSPRNAIVFLEQVWNRDLSSYDPEGPLPEIEPDISETRLAQGRANNQDVAGRLETARVWRELAERDKLSIRQLIIRVTGRQHFVGTPDEIATAINRYVQADAADGFVFAPHLTPSGFDEFVDRVVPILQERGVYRRDYGEGTLRSNLGLPDPTAQYSTPPLAAAV
ncbi:LLM class flavin-dependent oxidoreductase [Rhizobium binxianense]|uniref:LLM class flavin-dependent oxidoreductase n=1 Tax=Rhizobium binxianense TaxID=3024242 RepID=UPI00235E6AB1|nr:LLM class flavin-dependent oxidoreductase [Rhizobium sp. MC62]MDC9811580.1 LLM class flavin-dependent oxidoreductase [Rhizobium sp. MC62]